MVDQDKKPGPIFISYSRHDIDEVEVLVKALHKAGISTWQDINSLDAGLIETRIREAICDECSGLIFYATRKSIESDFIVHIELAEAMKKFKTDSSFMIVPVFKVPMDEADKALRGVVPNGISSFGGTVVVKDGEALDKVMPRICQRLLGGILSHEPDSMTNVAVMTYAPTPGDFEAMLDFNWKPLDSEELFTPSEWGTSIEQALTDAKDILISKGRENLRIHSKAHIQVGFAFGYVFRKETGFSLNIEHFDELWSTRTVDATRSHLTCKYRDGSVGRKHLAVSLSLTMDVENAVGGFVANNDIFRAFLDFCPVDGIIPCKIPGDDVAAEMAEEIRNGIIEARGKYNVTDIHLFAAIPLPLAYMIGWRLNACGRIHLYHHDRGANSYTPSWVIE